MSIVSFSGGAVDILVVDNNPDHLQLLSLILELQGYRVRQSLDGQLALQSVYRNPPDLILLDIHMPEMDGYEVCRQLKAFEITSDIPVVFISALNQPSDKKLAFELGGADYIVKPFQKLEVLARVNHQILIQRQQQLLREQHQQLQQEIQNRQQSEDQVRRLNTELERRVRLRTQELQRTLDFERALKHISDQVRDSLDQDRIVQMAVETLAKVLDVSCCDAALYSADHQTSTIRYQWVKPGLQATQGQMLYMTDFPELYEQLQQGIAASFCQIRSSPIRNHSATLACPIYDDQLNQTGLLGDLWVFRETQSTFDPIEVRLVQQVANQCAIALRQARLYAQVQHQVEDLERLNQLKDDFLSTISHELLSPLANMKMALGLLRLLMENPQRCLEELNKGQAGKVLQYLDVLQEESDRELLLVEDLLSLQHIEAGVYANQPTLIHLQEFLLHLIEPFEAIARRQQQTLQIDIAPDLPSVMLDPVGLNRVVTELLSNACKYTPVDGTIAISVHAFQDKVLNRVVDCLQMTVTNTGTEIPAEELSRIFDKFYRVPQADPWKHRGTGLGLTLVKRFVEQMKGTIEAGSANNQTWFTVEWSWYGGE